MPQSRSAGLLAFLLALPALSLVAPSATDAASTSAAPSPTPEAAAVNPAEALEARLSRLSEAIRERSGPLDAAERAALKGEPWVAAGAWGNGSGRGWANRSWPNRVYGNSYYGRPVWANYRPGWGNFRNGPSFLNW
jgi:rSAM-associated Gly-rich repeat protein